MADIFPGMEPPNPRNFPIEGSVFVIHDGPLGPHLNLC